MFVLKMSVREFRASWRRLLFFFLCVAVGVGAIVMLRSVIQSLRHGLMREARAMIASDVIVQTNRAWTPELRGRIDAILSEAPILARPNPSRRRPWFVPSRAVPSPGWWSSEASKPHFPSTARWRSPGAGGVYSHALLVGRGAIVGPELLVQLRMRVGERLMIGSQPFTIRGVIAQEPGRRIGAFSFGARVIIDLADLHQAGLLGFGSRANYQRLLKVREDGVDRLTTRLRDELRGQFASARSYASLDDIGADLIRAENYLSLVGLVIVVLGGIGVWSVTRVFVRQKIKSVAILKCLGATTGRVIATYAAQVALLGLAGSLTGVVLAGAAMRN